MACYLGRNLSKNPSVDRKFRGHVTRAITAFGHLDIRVRKNERLKRASQLQEEVEHWRTLCKEQESSLSEMATVVSSSKLEADNLRESHNALQDAQWTADSLVPNCSKCHVAFSVSRRRHHCRNCGLIFCHFCSTQTMSLPSAAKPVRVCDRCHNLLLHRYTAKS
ncbi:uncharacterized protein DEA37_0007681 [Paragonimus westermani]|uniref:FYVE-type domain-containing protein n=1 Tax=Paragonimus westermani TaxID=34504 RepID=A0A5J4NBF1_9TREM|nr:uncharacterized protein DEA37_0007681 [Paragonimus westermani]